MVDGTDTSPRHGLRATLKKRQPRQVVDGTSINEAPKNSFYQSEAIQSTPRGRDDILSDRLSSFVGLSASSTPTSRASSKQVEGKIKYKGSRVEVQSPPAL